LTPGPTPTAVAVAIGSPGESVRAIRAAQRAGDLPVLAPDGTSHELLELVTQTSAELVRAAPGQDLMVLPTSGTTSEPRAVVRTAASWVTSFAAFSQLTGIGTGDVVWAPGGSGSTLTLFAVWHAQDAGLDTVTTGPWRGVPRRGLDAVTVVQCVPPVLDDVVTARERGGLPRLRLAVVAGAALPRALRGRAAATGLDVVEYYGAAETSFVGIGRDALRPFPGVEVASRDGVLWCRSPYLALACLGERGSFVRDDEGWAGVGDRGTLAEDGVLRVHGRDAGLLVGGQVVLAADVERVLLDVPGVLDVVCLARPDARLGEHVVAVVRLAPAGPTPREAVAALRAAARRQLPPAARPRRFVVARELPRTPGGKVARAELARGMGLRLPAADALVDA